MNLERLRAMQLPPVEQTYTARDSMLYALGLGYGTDPLNASDLKFVFEQGREPLRAVPSMCVVLGHPGFWARRPELEIHWQKLLHGAQSFELHRELPAQGRVRAETLITAVEDKGVGKGAIIHQTKTLTDLTTGTQLATVGSAWFLRGDGGCGSFGDAPRPPEPVPTTEPVASVRLVTSPQSALLYRLNGDDNPLHADPEVAQAAGFERPILHGLCTLGVAVRAALDALALGRPERLASLSLRFSSPVYPGETLVTELFRGTSTESFRFRARVAERDVVVLDRGTLTLR